MSASPEELTTVTNALSAKERKPSPGLEGVKVLPSGPWFAAGVSTAPLLPDEAYMGLVLPMPGDMGARGLVNDDDALPPPGIADDEEGWDGDSRVTICASVHLRWRRDWLMRSSLARELSCCCCKRDDSSARLVACWLERAEASRSAATLAFNRSSKSVTCVWAWATAAVRSLRARARSCWTSPILMLVGHGRELVREVYDSSSVGLVSWTLFAQPHPLVRVLTEDPMCLHECLVQLLALEV